MQQNKLTNNDLSEKNTLWIASNIAAGALLTNIIVKFTGGMIFGRFVMENFSLGLIYTVVIILIGAWLGSKFGVQYVTNRSIINPSKINSISKIAAVIPFVFLLFFVIMDIYTSLAGIKPELTFIDLFTTVIFAIAIFFFVKKFLQKSIDQMPQPSNQTDIPPQTKNNSTKKILIGVIILATVGISAFFVLELNKNNSVSNKNTDDLIIESKIDEDYSTPEATFKTFLKAYENKNKDVFFRTFSERSLEKLDSPMQFSKYLDVKKWNNDLLSKYINADYKIVEQTDKYAIMAPQNRDLPAEDDKQDPIFYNTKSPRMGDIFLVKEENLWKIDISTTYRDVNLRSIYLDGYKTYSDGSSDIKTEKDILDEIKDRWRKNLADDSIARDMRRKDDIDIIRFMIFKYFEDHNQYPVSADMVKLNDKNSSVYRNLVPQYRENGLPMDPKDPDFYYSYKSTDGESFILTARLENLEDKDCKFQNNICIYKISW